MMTLSALTAADQFIEVDGEQYQLGQLDQMDQAAIEDRIKSKRRDPVEVAREMASMCTPEERKDLFAKAYDDAQRAHIVTAGEYDDFCNSLEGYRVIVWLCARKYRPQFTEADAGNLLEAIGRQWIESFVGELQSQFPDATRDQIVNAALTQEKGAMAQLIMSVAGLPPVNPTNRRRPTRKNGETSRSPAASGLQSSLKSLVAGLFRWWRK